MQRLSQIAALLAVLALLSGCGKKREETVRPTVLLETGTGALLVTFPKPSDFTPDEWLAQVNLNGPAETRSCPRIPLSEIQALMVLNIPPGSYEVTSLAWMRTRVPDSGGTLPKVEIRAAEVTVLRCPSLGGNPTFQPTQPLIALGRASWTLSQPEQFPDFVAEILRTSAKG